MVRHIITLIPILALAACTNGRPQFSDLGSGVPQPLYWGKTSHSIDVEDPNLDIPIAGSCDKRVTKLEFRIVGFHDWGPATVFASGPVTEDCLNNESFSFNLKSLNSMAVWDTAATVRFKLEARSVYSIGESSISHLQINYVVPATIKIGEVRIGQGAGVASSPSFRARATVSPVSGSTAQSTAFELNRGVR